MRQLHLVPRRGVYELYWQFAYERQRIFEARQSGLPQPWTDDPILQHYKFCNVYRACDRVSQYMIRHVCYNPVACSSDDRLFQIVAFRTFSNEATWNTITDYLGRPPVIDDLANNRFAESLNDALAKNGTLYTNAFILCAQDAYNCGRKHLNHVELFKDMFIAKHLGESLRAAPSLEAIYHLLHGFPLMGNFMSYQTAIDLNYSDIIHFSENDFTKAGPGALRGIKKIFVDTGGATPEDIIMWLVSHQEEEFARFGLHFNGLYGRMLHAIDCQGLLCETDKYCRVARPHIVSSRSRIKTLFVRPKAPLNLFFPPKWHLLTT